MFNPSAISRLAIRAPNWLGDAVMSLPAMRAIRESFAHARIAVIVRPGLADLYSRESSIDEVIPYPAPKTLADRIAFARRLRSQHFDAAILLQNAFDAALVAWFARIPERIGYARDARRWLLTRPIAVPDACDIPRHERFYYLELLRRIGLLESVPAAREIRLESIDVARREGAGRFATLALAQPVIGVSPGAAYGHAKRWPAERFVETARQLSTLGSVAIFGSAAERELCQSVAAAIPGARNLAGETTLGEFIDLAASCRLFLCNDSGAMHVANALAVPTVAIFGATDDVTTGPTGPLARVIREHAECAPCLLRECPIDHRCMTRVRPARVAAAARELLESAPWTLAPKS